MAGEAAESGLRFFLDRGLGAYVVPRALRAAGWMLETMDERYGTDQSQNIQDTQWIEEATLAGDVLLCKDLAIAQNPLEAQAVYMTSARMFGLSNASITGPVAAQWYLDNEARIVRAALGAAGPYVMAVNPAYGLRRAQLAYPLDRSHPLRLGLGGHGNSPSRAPDPCRYALTEAQVSVELPSVQIRVICAPCMSLTAATWTGAIAIRGPLMGAVFAAAY